MLSINTQLLEEENHHIRYILNYPCIKNKEESSFVSYINKKIYEDIACFKDVIEGSLNMNIAKSYTINVITECRITFNKNNIISIPIEFSQLVGLYDISYINVYNYDINLEKEIRIGDIFNQSIDYVELINEDIRNQMESNNEEILEKEDINSFIGICENQVFYIDNDGIVICFSSYEIGYRIYNTIEFKIKFEDYVNYLSEYTMKKLYEKISLERGMG